MGRPEIVGEETPQSPFPIEVETTVSSGFGRGSSELGIPTANISPELLEDLDPGVYYGWASVALSKETDPNDKNAKVDFNYGKDLGDLADKVFPMVMSIGWNPFYNNTKKSAEVHIIQKFHCNFYGAKIKVAVLGYIRPEQSYDNVDSLIADIKWDIKVALKSLERPDYQACKQLAQF